LQRRSLFPQHLTSFLIRSILQRTVLYHWHHRATESTRSGIKRDSSQRKGAQTHSPEGCVCVAGRRGDLDHFGPTHPAVQRKSHIPQQYQTVSIGQARKQEPPGSRAGSCATFWRSGSSRGATFVHRVCNRGVSRLAHGGGGIAHVGGGMPSARAGTNLYSSRLPCPITVTVTTQTSGSTLLFHAVATLNSPAPSRATTAPPLTTQKPY